MYIYIAIVSIILFVALIHIIDKNNVETHKPPLTTPVKVGLFVLCFVATMSVFSLVGEEPIVLDDVPLSLSSPLAVIVRLLGIVWLEPT